MVEGCLFSGQRGPLRRLGATTGEFAGFDMEQRRLTLLARLSDLVRTAGTTVTTDGARPLRLPRVDARLRLPGAARTVVMATVTAVAPTGNATPLLLPRPLTAGTTGSVTGTTTGDGRLHPGAATVMLRRGTSLLTTALTGMATLPRTTARGGMIRQESPIGSASSLCMQPFVVLVSRGRH